MNENKMKKQQHSTTPAISSNGLLVAVLSLVEPLSCRAFAGNN